MSKKVTIITNVPSPYRVDFFYYLQTHYSDYEFSVMYYCNDSMARQWKADEDRILNSHFVPAIIIIVNGLEKYLAIYPLVRYLIPATLKLKLNKSKKSG